jgi:PAS domain S-box-containing protein
VPEAFSRFAEILPDALLLVDRNGRLVAANSRARALLGLRAAEIAGITLFQLADESAENVEALLASCARTRQAVPGTLRFRHREGALQRCRCEGGVYRPAGGEGEPPLILLRLTPSDHPHDRFALLTHEIGELSKEIRRRIRVEEELHRQREWLRVTLASIGDAVMATDAAEKITFINPAASELTGWTEEEALGRPLSDVFRIVNEESRAPVESPVARVIREGVVAALANHTLLIGRDGREIPIDDSGAPIRHEDGRLAGVVLVFRDITEQRQLERELENRARFLNDINRRKDEFLAMLSHELRNPLAPLRNCLTMLQMRGTLDASAQPLLGIMDRQVSQLTRLVDDLLDVSRITTGKIKVLRGALALEHLVLKALEPLEPLLTRRRQRLETELEALSMEGDEARLTQVVVNLVENASKYTPAGGHIAVRLRREGASALLTVEDDGIGIDPDLLPTVFELFTQADRSPDRAQSGLGVGLALVRSLVELHGGSVSAHSGGLGRGSVFAVRLPLSREQP